MWGPSLSKRHGVLVPVGLLHPTWALAPPRWATHRNVTPVLVENLAVIAALALLALLGATAVIVTLTAADPAPTWSADDPSHGTEGGAVIAPAGGHQPPYTGLPSWRP